MGLARRLEVEQGMDRAHCYDHMDKLAMMLLINPAYVAPLGAKGQGKDGKGKKGKGKGKDGRGKSQGKVGRDRGGSGRRGRGPG